MTRRATFIAVALLALSSVANAAISVSSPVTKNLYVDSVFVSWSTTTTPKQIRMTWTMTGGFYYTAGVTQQWTMVLASTSTHSSFSFNPSQIVASAGGASYPITSISPNTNLPDGTYSVQMSYTDSSNVSFPSSTILLVQTSTGTIPPVLTAPASGTMYTSPLNVTYQLPSVPAVGVGSVQLLFTGQLGNSLTLDLSPTSQLGTFAIDTSNVTTGGSITSASASTLPDDIYSVELLYSDSQGHPAASVTNTGVIIETATPLPTLTTPVDGGAYHDLSFSYSLPTTPRPGSVIATINPGNYTVQLPDAPLTNTFTASNPTLANGSGYVVTLSYQDAVGNPAASASATGVSYHLQTDPPVMTAPTAGSYSSIPIALTLPDSALGGTVQLVFSGAQSTTITLEDGVTSAALSPHNLLGSTGVAFASPSSLPDGPYTVVAQYQDTDGHAAASSAPVSITVDTITMPPMLAAPTSGSSGLSIPILYTLPELATPGTVMLEFAGPVHASAIMSDVPPASTSYVDAAMHSPVAPFVQLSGFPLPPGKYSVILSYQDVLGNPAAYAIASSVTLGALAFSIAGATVNEADGTVNVPVTLSGGSGAVSVSYATSNGSATAGTDFTSTTGTLSWAGGDAATKNISIPITDNHLNGASRTFSVTLSSPAGAVLSTNSATVTIVENDALPTLGIANATANETAGTATMTVTMSGHSGQAVTVQYATTDGSARAGTNYTTTSGTLSWSAGETGDKTLTIPVTDDEVATGNLTVEVALSSPAHASVTRTNATLTIADHETASIVLNQPDGHTAVGEGGTSDTFTLVLSSQPTADVTITPVSGSLLLVAPMALTFTAGNWQTAQTVTVTGPSLGAISADTTTVVGFTVASSDTLYDDFGVGALTVAIAHVSPPDMSPGVDMSPSVDLSPGVDLGPATTNDGGISNAPADAGESTDPNAGGGAGGGVAAHAVHHGGCGVAGDSDTAPLAALSLLVLVLLAHRRRTSDPI